MSHHAMHPRGTDGPSPIQKAAVGIGYSTIALHHHPASCLRHKHSKCAYPLFFGQTRGWRDGGPSKALDQGALDGAQPIGATEITLDIGDKAIECLGRANAAVQLAARKQLPRVALCERRRAGFARLSGWQPVGNWVASAANFPASLLYVGVTPTTSRRIATRSLRRKMARSPSRAGGQRTRLQLTGKGRNHPPRRGSFFIE